MRNVALDVGSRTTFAEAMSGDIVKRGVVESVEGLVSLLGPGTESAG